MKGLKRITNSKFWWLMLLVILVAVNFLASAFHSRFDLTREKRYTLSKATKDLLKNLNGEVRIDVFLKGDFPAGFRKLANSVDEFLDNCREYGGHNLSIRFIDPFKAARDSAEAFIRIARQDIAQDSLKILRDTSGSMQSQIRMFLLKGKDKDAEKKIIESYTYYYIDSLSSVYSISPFVLQSPEKVGDEQKEKTILPGAVVYYKDKDVGVDLLKGAKSYGSEPEELARLYNDVEATLEYKFASAIKKASSDKRAMVGYALGHGEGWGYNVDDAVRTIAGDYRLDTVNIKTIGYIPSDLDALVILKPTEPFSDADKFKIDQYIMGGGKILWMIDNLYAEYDSLFKLRGGSFVAFDRGLNLEDLLFKYGVRINNNLLQDMQCDKLPSPFSDPKQQRLAEWPFFPVLNGTDHPISKNLGGVRSFFPQTLDTIRTPGVKGTFLLRSSANARILSSPMLISYDYMQIAPDIKQFTVHDTTVAVLLEGKFPSAFRNLVSQQQMNDLRAAGTTFLDQSKETKMIVVADGDVAMNQISPSRGPLPMGMNLFTNYTFANKEFFSNSLEYLVDPSGILKTRAKNYTLRLLDPVKVRRDKTMWQLINIALPVLLVVIFGLIYQQMRKRKYAA